MSVTTLLAAAAAKKGLKNVVDDVYGLLKRSLKHKVKLWSVRGKIDRLYHKIRTVRYVKTIWQVEKAVDLAKFYCPSRVDIDGQRKQIDDISDLPGRHIVIRGSVGQGKSIFLRYLTARELVKGNAIPLFVELRRIGRGRSLRDHLLEELESLGLKMDSELLYFLCKQGKLVLFLDAFDEIEEQQRTGLVEEIEHLCKRYDCLRVIISSRPHSGIENSTFFSVHDLSPLKGDEYEDVIRRMSDRSSSSKEVISGVKRTGIDALLTTPLMVALLLVRYRIDQSIPENMIAFYEDLFYLLLRRHDKTKAGYVRPRKSNVSDLALKQLFDAICYLDRKKAPGRLTVQDLQGSAEEACTLLNVSADVTNVVADIIEITCLILEEGGECRFVHKSVQEFHAASFVSDQTDEGARQFYRGMLQRWREWRAELFFLSQIDQYRFQKWFLIPDVEKTIRSVRKHWSNGRPTIGSAAFVFGSVLEVDEIGIDSRDLRISMYGHSFRDKTWSLATLDLFDVFRIAFDVTSILQSVKSGKLSSSSRQGLGDVCVKVGDLLRVPSLRGQLTRAVRYIHDGLVSKREEAQRLMECVQERKAIFEF